MLEIIPPKDRRWKNKDLNRLIGSADSMKYKKLTTPYNTLTCLQMLRASDIVVVLVSVSYQFVFTSVM